MKIYRIAEYYKRYYTLEIAGNPNTSPEILKKILEQGNNDLVSRCAVKNPNCPAYLLEMVLKRGKNDDVSLNASNNPNCPLKAKIQWMQSVGIIGKEDPSKHIIEREEIEYKEDPDLKKLRDLISKSNSWYKTAELDYSDITKDFPPISEEEQNHIKNMKNKWIYVQSSFIQCVAYFEPLKLFEVKLKNGKTYEYSNISKELFDQFMASDSKGKFLNKIRNRF